MAKRSVRKPIAQLTELHPNSPNFAKLVNSLSDKYDSWCEVPADGNCHYHAMARSLFEHYCRPYTDTCELKTFHKLLYYQQLASASDQDLSATFQVLEKVEQLMKTKQETGHAIDKLHDLLENSQFMNALIQVLRRLAYSAFLHHKPQHVYYEGIEEDLSQLLSLGTLSSSTDYIGLALALNVEVTEAELSKSDYEVRIQSIDIGRNSTEQEPISRLILHIGLTDNHHYVLFPKGIDELDRFEKERYVMPEKIELSDVERYEKVVKSR